MVTLNFAPLLFCMASREALSGPRVLSCRPLPLGLGGPVEGWLEGRLMSAAAREGSGVASLEVGA